jgi:hypothetical protein
MDKISRLYAKTPIVKRSNSSLRIQRKKVSKQLKSPADRILFLQRTIGNQAVQRLIKSMALQAKLKIGQPGDKYEQEADRVAEQVMWMTKPQATSSGAPHIKRACPTCEEEELKWQPIEEEEEKLQRQPMEEEEKELQAKAISDNISEVNPDFESHIHSLKGGGQPLSENDRAFFEPRFGRDFNSIRVHSDNRAADLSKSINAKAFTLGQDVVFGSSQYSPENITGKRLIAHELTHVIQQNSNLRSGNNLDEETRLSPSSMVQRQPTKWALDAGKIYTDRAGAVTRGRELQQSHTSIEIVKHGPKKYQVKYRNPVPINSGGFPKEDSGYFYDKPEPAELRAKVLRAYGYVVSVFRRPDGKYQCRMTALMGAAPSLPRSIGLDSGFVFVAKASAERRADALKTVGYNVEVRTPSSKKHQVFIKALPSFATAKSTTKSVPKLTAKPKAAKPVVAKAGTLPHKLVVINSKDPEKKELNDAVAKSYRDFVAEVKTLTGKDLALNFGDTVRELAAPTSKVGADTVSWHKTGRAVDIDQTIEGWVIRENPKGKDMYFTIYLKHATPTTKAKAPIIVNFPKGTKFNYFYYPVKPKDAYVNVTEVAKKHGWLPIPAQKGWKSKKAKMEWWHFEKRGGLSWYQALKEIYTEKTIVTGIQSFAKGTSGANKYGARLKREGVPDNVLEKIFTKVTKGALGIRLPVGDTQKAANLTKDVQEVQKLLIKAKFLTGTGGGTMNLVTIAAIKKFQKSKLKISSPDSRIDVGGGTHKELGKVK